MRLKRICLIACLLGLPAAFADAAQVTINVPVDISNVPAGVTQVNVECRAGVGPAPPGTGIWTAANARGTAGKGISIPPSGSYRGTVQVVINAGDDATHYKCMLKGYEGQPPFEGQNQVSGPIPVDVPIRRP